MFLPNSSSFLVNILILFHAKETAQVGEAIRSEKMGSGRGEDGGKGRKTVP